MMKSHSENPLTWLRGAVFATALRLSLIGKPVPCPRPRVSRNGGVFYPKNYTDWRDAALKQLTAGVGGFKEPVAVALDAIVERPKTTVRLLPGGDVDNYAKSVLDILTKVKVWLDDDLVELLLVRKRWAVMGEEAGFNVWIGPMGVPA